jgi:hypothetical protein
MAEAGVPGYDLAAWFAAFVPAKTPGPIVDKLRDALVKAFDDKPTQEKLLQAGIDPETSKSEDLKSFVEAEIKKVGRDRDGRRHSTRIAGSLDFERVGVAHAPNVHFGSSADITCAAIGRDRVRLAVKTDAAIARPARPVLEPRRGTCVRLRG